MTVTDARSTPRRHQWPSALALGGAWAVASAIATWHDPMRFAFAGLLGVTMMLPLADRWLDYAAATGIVVLAVAIGSGLGSATVVASVAFSLWSLVAIAVACRVQTQFAIAATIALAAILPTWPIWAAELILTFDSQRLVDWLTWLGPLFAINRAIDPTDAFTHRPWSYRWLNLGQDVPYALPATIWPCVLSHVLLGVLGGIGRRWTQMNADKIRTSGAAS